MIMNKINLKFPLSEEELHIVHKEAKEKAVEFCDKKAVGPEALNIREKLKNSIIEKYQSLKIDNEEESEKKCSIFLINSYASIEQKLRNDEYKNFVEYEREIKKLQRFFNERGPDGPYKAEIFLNFCQKKIVDTAEFFIKERQSEIEFLNSSYSDKIKSLESEIKEYKEEYIKERSELQKRLTSAESEKTELSVKENSLKDQLMSIRAEKDKSENDSRNTIKSIRAELSSQVEAANSRVLANEEKMKEIERLCLQKDSEFKEDKALMEQKIAYLEKSLEESRKKEKEYLNNLRSQKKDNSMLIKELQTKYESQIKNLQTRLENEIDRVNELEKELEEKERDYESYKQMTEENNIKYKNFIDEKTQLLESKTSEFQKAEKEYKQKEANKAKETENSFAKLVTKLEETEKKLKSTEENFKSQITQLNKENAILAQKNEFSEHSLTELKSQLESERKQHSNMLLS